MKEIALKLPERKLSTYQIRVLLLFVLTNRAEFGISQVDIYQRGAQMIQSWHCYARQSSKCIIFRDRQGPKNNLNHGKWDTPRQRSDSCVLLEIELSPMMPLTTKMVDARELTQSVTQLSRKYCSAYFISFYASTYLQSWSQKLHKSVEIAHLSRSRPSSVCRTWPCGSSVRFSMTVWVASKPHDRCDDNFQGQTSSKGRETPTRTSI